MSPKLTAHITDINHTLVCLSYRVWCTQRNTRAVTSVSSHYPVSCAGYLAVGLILINIPIEHGAGNFYRKRSSLYVRISMPRAFSPVFIFYHFTSATSLALMLTYALQSVVSFVIVDIVSSHVHFWYNGYVDYRQLGGCANHGNRIFSHYCPE